MLNILLIDITISDELKIILENNLLLLQNASLRTTTKINTYEEYIGSLKFLYENKINKKGFIDIEKLDKIEKEIIKYDYIDLINIYKTKFSTIKNEENLLILYSLNYSYIQSPYIFIDES